MLRLVGHYHHPVISSTLSSLSRSSLPLTRLLTPPSLSSLVLHRNYKTSSKKKVISKKVVSKKDEKDKKKKKMDNKKKEKKTKEPTPPPAEATVESSNASSSTSTTSQSSIIMRKKVLDANGFPTQVYILPLFNDVAFPELPLYADSVPGLTSFITNYKKAAAAAAAATVAASSSSSSSSSSPSTSLTAPVSVPSDAMFVGLFLVKESVREQVKNPKDFVLESTDQLHDVGVLASVLTYRSNEQVLMGRARISIDKVVAKEENNTLADITILKPPAQKASIDLRARFLEILNKMQSIILAHPNSNFTRNIISSVPTRQEQDMYLTCDVAASACTTSLNETQQVLEALDLEKRQDLVLWILHKEQLLHELQDKIGRNMEEKTQKFQRKYFLNEQMKSIRKELGMEQDEKETLVVKFRDRLKNLTLPEDVNKLVNDELTKLSSLEPVSSEYNVTRNYLDWLTNLPWGVYTKENLDIDHATNVLNKEHYGLNDIKERILEFIAMGKLNGTVQGKIILLVGPPGTGKTSIGKSIANALQREFYRFSVGGLTDPSEIKGHRRTYIGAMPGKLIQGIKMVKTSNPVILIDEIDKLGQGYHGDPSAALLEVLDPEQNNTFLDHYLDVPYDLSKVLFVCTANVIDTIPKPLLDRMEVLTLSGYIPSEQKEIARKHLIPAGLLDNGLTSAMASITQTALDALVRHFCRDAGVRNLKKHIEKIFRKVAFNRVTSKQTQKSIAPTVVTNKNLEEFVGKPIYTSDRFYNDPVAGVVMGLAWTAAGGATLYVETAVERFGKGPELRTTGQMGDVMKESTNIAYTFAKTHIGAMAPGNRFFETTSLHMHIPEGATPKDGPSAGCTMITSLFSLALQTPVLPNLAMTGEVTLTGKVLAIGGVREKLIAAQRSGAKTVILPNDNRKDWDDVPEHIREGLTVHFVDYYHDIFSIAFPTLKPMARKVK